MYSIGNVIFVWNKWPVTDYVDWALLRTVCTAVNGKFCTHLSGFASSRQFSICCSRPLWRTLQGRRFAFFIGCKTSIENLNQYRSHSLQQWEQLKIQHTVIYRNISSSHLAIISITHTESAKIVKLYFLQLCYCFYKPNTQHN